MAARNAFKLHVFEVPIGLPSANHYQAIVSISQFICKTAAFRTAAQSITSKNVYRFWQRLPIRAV